MQPEFSPGPRSQEILPPPSMESYEAPPANSPETLSNSPEQLERRSSAELAPPPPAMPVLQPMPVATPPPTLPVAAPVQANPIAANDDDDIEKEWVDRAKQIIQQTRDNPQAREKAIGELQRDYLMKRYGRKVGASND